MSIVKRWHGVLKCKWVENESVIEASNDVGSMPMLLETKG